ncbi:hypothetical protein B0H14DRAFT_2621730 [Mycena olivaceomarginata]|nr:hypothetical protein B0H14DRAFT_2621730 [Mycena olivaceomarginata]
MTVGPNFHPLCGVSLLYPVEILLKCSEDSQYIFGNFLGTPDPTLQCLLLQGFWAEVILPPVKAACTCPCNDICNVHDWPASDGAAWGRSLEISGFAMDAGLRTMPVRRFALEVEGVFHFELEYSIVTFAVHTSRSEIGSDTCHAPFLQKDHKIHFQSVIQILSVRVRGSGKYSTRKRVPDPDQLPLSPGQSKPDAEFFIQSTFGLKPGSPKEGGSTHENSNFALGDTHGTNTHATGHGPIWGNHQN